MSAKYSYPLAKERADRAYGSVVYAKGKRKDIFFDAMFRFFDWVWLTKGAHPTIEEVAKLMNASPGNRELIRAALNKWLNGEQSPATFPPLWYLETQQTCWCKFYESCPACFGKK